MNANRNLQSRLLRERLQAHWPDRGRAPVAAKIALPIAGARTRSLVRAIGLALSRPSFLFAARGHLPGPSKVGQGMRTMLRRRGRQLPGRVPGRRRRGRSWRRSESQAARPLPWVNWTDFLGVAAPQPSGQFPAVPHPSAGHISGKDRGQTARRVWVMSSPPLPGAVPIERARDGRNRGVGKNSPIPRS